MPRRQRLRDFFSELKRRHVFRVASIYAVAAWMAVQIADVATPALPFLPAWTVTAAIILALIGFPIALILGWAFDITAEGVERTDEGGTQVVRMPWLRPVIAATLIVLISGGSYLWLRARSNKGAGDEAVAVAVFPFEVNGTPDVLYLRDGMPTLLSTQMDGAGRFRAIDPTALLKAVANRKADFQPAAAAPVARQFDADLFVLGSVTERNDSVSIAAALYDATDTETQLTNTVTPFAPEDQVLVLVDAVAKSLVASRFRTEAERLSRVAALTTNSLDALKAYLAGEAEYRASRWVPAMDWFQRALGSDSTFALAAYRRASAAEWASQAEVSRAATALAMQHRARLGERDKFLLEAYDAWSRGRVAVADSMYREATEKYPEDGEAWYRLGEVLYHYNPVRGRSVKEAKQPFERALALNPDAQHLRFHLMEMALQDRNYRSYDSLAQAIDAEGEAALRRNAVRTVATGNQPEIDRVIEQLKTAPDGTVLVIAAGLAQYLHDFDRATQVAEILTDPTRVWVAQGVASVLLAQLDAGRGRWNSAKMRLDTFQLRYRTAKQIAAVRNEYLGLFAAAPVLPFPELELRHVMGQLQLWDAAAVPDLQMPPEWLGVHNGIHADIRAFTMGILAARLRDTASTRNNVALLQQQQGGAPALAQLRRSMSNTLLAETALVRDKHDEALRHLTPVDVHPEWALMLNSPIYSQAHQRFLHAEALAASGKHEEALSWLESLIGGRSELYLMGPALLRSAQYSAQVGRKKEAVAYYEEFIRLWRGADEPFQPLLKEAEAALAKLK